MRNNTKFNTQYNVMTLEANYLAKCDYKAGWIQEFSAEESTNLEKGRQTYIYFQLTENPFKMIEILVREKWVGAPP